MVILLQRDSESSRLCMRRWGLAEAYSEPNAELDERRIPPRVLLHWRLRGRPDLVGFGMILRWALFGLVRCGHEPSPAPDLLLVPLGRA